MPGEIQLEELTKRFGDATSRSTAWTWRFRQGEFFSLLGPSGCGKTTTLRMVAGFEQPTRASLPRRRPGGRRGPVQAQRQHGVPELRAVRHLDVQGNVAFGLKRRKVAAPEIAERVQESLELVQLTGPREGEAVGAVRRPAPARGARPRAGEPARGAPARRAARRARSEARARCRSSSRRSSARSASPSSTSRTTRRKRSPCPTASRSWTPGSWCSAGRRRRSTSARRSRSWPASSASRT